MEALRQPSLVRRLVILAAGWSLAVLLVSAIVLAMLFQQAAIRRFDQGLSELIDNLTAGTTIADKGEVIAPALTDLRALRAFSGKYWQIAEPAAGGKLRVLVRSRSLWDSELKAPADIVARLNAEPGRPVSYDTRGPLNEPLRAMSTQAKLPNRAAPVIFMAAEDRSPVDHDVRGFITATAVAFLLLGVGMIAAVVIQVRVGLNPLFALRREVASVRRGKAERVQRTYPTELSPLAEELNALMAHNQEVVERQRTHVGNLAHALKTPLSVMLTEARQTGGPLADIVEAQAEAMRLQVDHHLRRARAAARTQGSGERTSVADVLDELSRTLERIFLDKGVEIDWDAEDDLYFLGERQDLLELAGNAMENAGKWCTGRVRVRAIPSSAERLKLTIEDDGPGLTAEQRDEVVQRGARLDETAPGSGLGLSIVDELARAYGGSLKLGQARLGGLLVELELPRAEA
ncbi:MAG: sensor histidine kinase [Pseudomonadota bacterium]|uniref:sensor histidine kinase n=1 Tax=unclassified Phenylobacterium TaxID=2640670 RepID=UPI0006FE4BFD|nr:MULTISPECIES: sensor histidine kinase [unclassified Phenylobacterium]KRB48942.1 histidine kinase [Phenylobacterium sp. Root700]MBT9472810.1 sensor histidine kinase [Phenylobacterium sp.]